MKSGVNDPDCAQIGRELNVVSVSAESHGLTCQFTWQIGRHLTFGLYFRTLLSRQMVSYRGVSGRRERGGGRGSRCNGKVADAEGRAGVGWEL